MKNILPFNVDAHLNGQNIRNNNIRYKYKYDLDFLK